jgi:hypothetical protein
VSRVKYQHYVPRFYLEGFRSSSFKLWCYDKLKDKIFQQSPDRLGGETLFYDIPDADKEIGITQFLEKWFRPLESDASSTLKSWREQLDIDGTISLTEAEIAIMARFITVQELRTPQREETRSGGR